MSSTFDHTRAPRRHWWIVIIASLVTLICGTIGGMISNDGKHAGGHSTAALFLTSAYGAFQMMLLHSPHYEGGSNTWLEVARWTGVVALAWTTSLLLFDRVRHEIRLLKLATWKGHYVLFGMGQRGMALIQSIRRRDPRAKIVAVDSNPEHGFVAQADQAGVCVLRMDATDHRTFKLSRVATAGEIVLVTGNDETNIRLAAAVRHARQQVNSPHAYCRAHIAGSYLSTALQAWTDSTTDLNTTLRFFDVFDNEARRVLLNQSAEGFAESPESAAWTAIDAGGISANDDRNVHVLVLGMGRMGSSIVLRAAKMGHFANGKDVRITVIDRVAKKQHDQLLFRYPILAKKNEICELEMLELEAESPAVRNLMEQYADQANTVLHVFVCLDNDARAVEIGLRLWQIIRGNPRAYLNIRIKSKASLSPILQASGAGIRTFGMLEDTCSEESFRGEKNEVIARSIHADFAKAQKEKGGREDDPALVDWDRLREDFRESNRQQADHMPIKLRAIGCRIVKASAPGQAVTRFTPEEIELLAILEHRRWNAERWLSGWRYGPETDKPNLIHECLVPWDKLPHEIQEYDRDAVRNIPALLAQATPAMKVIRV